MISHYFEGIRSIVSDGQIIDVNPVIIIMIIGFLGIFFVGILNLIFNLRN